MIKTDQMDEFSATDYACMAEALRLARRGLASTHPNPRVGCVLSKNGQSVGRGWHQVAGGPHAEIMALDQAGGQAQGSTAYVTLEPCAHQGRTGPCAKALIDAGVKRVVAAMQDPHPAVGGRGLAMLAEAGIDATCGLLEPQAEVLNRGFLSRIRRGRPWLRVKLAASLDGRTAMADGHSQWITSEAARADVQHWRARASALMTGSGTVLCDDPQLTVRLAEYSRQPLRVVMDSRFRIPADAKVMSDGMPTWVFGLAPKPKHQVAQGLRLIEVDAAANGKPDLHQVMGELAAAEINEIQVEAGATLCGALLRAGLVDELLLYLAPHLLGHHARGLFALPGLESMADRIKLKWTDCDRVGSDLRLRLGLS